MRLSDHLVLQQVSDDVMVLMDDSTGEEITFSRETLRVLVENGWYFLDGPAHVPEARETCAQAEARTRKLEALYQALLDQREES